MRTRMMLAALGVLALVAITLIGLSIGLSSGQAAGPFLVNSTGDAVDDDIGDGACETAGGVCTLRAAIQEANHANNPGSDDIDFAITGCPSGVCTIQPGSALPAISDPVVIDGYSQTGAAVATASTVADLRILLDGTSAGAGVHALLLTGGNSTVRGLVIKNFSSFPSAGVKLESDENQVLGNHIGTDRDGEVAQPNFIGAWLLDASNNTIGGSDVEDRNVISANIGQGSYGFGDLDANVVEGNFIGVNAAGDTPLSNGGEQIFWHGNPTNNWIGGTTGLSDDGCTGSCNVISGGYVGIEFSSGSDNHYVGNYIGTDVTGTKTDADFAHNLYGAYMNGGLTDTEVRDNLIGNSKIGVMVDTASYSNDIYGNRIGIGNVPSGESDPVDMGLTVAGIRVSSQTVSGHIIGGTDAGEGNIIANNAVGIDVGGDTVSGNAGFCQPSTKGVTISGNSIFDNDTIGIDLVVPVVGTPCAVPAVTLNDDGDTDGGANALQNFPELRATAHVPAFGALLVYAILDSTTGPFTVEFFANDSCDSSGHGEGSEFLGSVTGVDPDEMFTFVKVGNYTGKFITATATDELLGNTSEFSKCREVKGLDNDADLDGCTDQQESLGDATKGGLRDSDNFWDFFDTETENGLGAGTAKAGEITVADRTNVIAHLLQTGDPDVNADTVVDAADALTDATGSGYHPRFDVGPKIPGGNHWDRLPADGAINIADDYIAIVNQVGHSCL